MIVNEDLWLNLQKIQRLNVSSSAAKQKRLGRGTKKLEVMQRAAGKVFIRSDKTFFSVEAVL